MDQQTNLPPNTGYVHKRIWPGVLLSLLLLAGVVVLDYVTGWQTSVTLFYLAPVSAATWFCGRRIGAVFACAAAGAGLMLSLAEECPLQLSLWNCAVKLGVYLAFCVLLDHVRLTATGLPSRRVMLRAAGWGVAATVALAIFGFAFQRAVTKRQAMATTQATTSPAHEASELQTLASSVRTAMRASRPVLLGSRDPTGPSCVAIISRGELQGQAPLNPGDLNGGPGTTMATLYYFDRQNFKSALADFNWHQTRLKTYLQNEAVSNEEALASARDLAERAMTFHQRSQQWTSLPQGLRPIGFGDQDDWPSYCLAALDRAVAARDLSQVQHWSGELAAASFALADLHEWLAFLVGNQLAALDFQKKCESLFVAADPLNPNYEPQSTISQFPAGVLSLNGMGNYYEVERQAERLFSMPADRIDEIALNKHLTSGSLWVPPGVRPCFLKVREVLSESNRKALDEAARTNCEHSFLVNMLYRSWTTDSAVELCESLRRFDALNPNATVTELMGAMMYRGHSFAGLEWADRYLPELMDAAGQIEGSDEQAFMSACAYTNLLYRQRSEYGVTLTLRDALEKKRLDCVRVTDMIGAVFRNAGRTRFGHARWCAETAGHSVAAYFKTVPDGATQVLLADGMNPAPAPEHWPGAYFHGHAWPAGFEQHPTPYAVELYARGIDSYIWTEGYIVRGPNAGLLVQARVPYYRTRQEATSKKVFDGPYPP